MSNERISKNRSATFTSGTIRNVVTNCEQLNVRGAVAFQHEVRVKEISTHGYSSFHSVAVAYILKNSGACVFKDSCIIDEVSNGGKMKLRHGKMTTLKSTGSLIVEDRLQAKHFHALGIVQAKEIQAEHFHLELSGRSNIDRLLADDIYVEKDKLSIPLLKKKLICKNIKGKTLKISNTEAETVEGDIVTVGNNCMIHTLYYTESYSISSNAHVQHIRSKK